MNTEQLKIPQATAKLIAALLSFLKTCMLLVNSVFRQQS